MFDKVRHVHFIGIGGSGISALAQWMKQKGKQVSGSDASDGPYLRQLKAQGIACHVGHDARQLPDQADLVIYSQAIDKTSNPEYLEATKRNIPTMSYFEALGELSKTARTIAVTGTHGKTTTTAMLGQALVEAEKDPTVVVGSRVTAFGGSNLRMGQGQWLVAEACEYRGSFLHLQPFGAVLLNCEAEHLDYYQNEENYVKAFIEFVQKIPAEGFLVYNANDENSRKISQEAKCALFPVTERLASELNLSLKVIGQFNQMNAAHAYLAALQTGAPAEQIKRGLEAFAGTARRLELKGEKKGVELFDDYAHHPTEIKATLKALREAYPSRKIICVFQPHQYSRTHALLHEFEHAFIHADHVMIPNICEARDSEEDKRKISAEQFVDTLSKHHPHAEWTENLEKTAKRLSEEAKPTDIIVTMGAGDVYKAGDMFLDSK